MFLLHETELLQLVQNVNNVTLAVHHLKMPCLSETRSVTKGLNSEALFPPEKCLSTLWDHFGNTKNDQGVI